MELSKQSASLHPGEDRTPCRWSPGTHPTEPRRRGAFRERRQGWRRPLNTPRRCVEALGISGAWHTEGRKRAVARREIDPCNPSAPQRHRDESRGRSIEGCTLCIEQRRLPLARRNGSYPEAMRDARYSLSPTPITSVYSDGMDYKSAYVSWPPEADFRPRLMKDEWSSRSAKATARCLWLMTGTTQAAGLWWELF